MKSLDQNTTLLDLDFDFNDFIYRSHAQLIEAITAHKRLLVTIFSEIVHRHIQVLKEKKSTFSKFVMKFEKFRRCSIRITRT